MLIGIVCLVLYFSILYYLKSKDREVMYGLIVPLFVMFAICVARCF